jgi:hypothetical protein
LSLLYLITFGTSLSVTCKFRNFMNEAKIAKIFYVSIMLLCLVRGVCFGASTYIFVDSYQDKKNAA